MTQEELKQEIDRVFQGIAPDLEMSMEEADCEYDADVATETVAQHMWDHPDESIRDQYRFYDHIDSTKLVHDVVSRYF